MIEWYTQADAIVCVRLSLAHVLLLLALWLAWSVYKKIPNQR